MRLIDADALIKDNGLESATKYGNRSEKQRVASYSTMMLYEIAEMIDEAPTIDAEPVRHGRWIFKEMDELVPTGELGVAEGHHIHLSSGATFKPNEKGIIVLKEHKRVKKPYCSECGDHGDDEYDATPYCPNCGAKMDGGAENETD